METNVSAELGACKRISIVGSAGSGKSTLATKLGQTLGLPVVHLDSLYWKPDWVESTAEEFDRLMEQELRRPEWIVDGNYNRTLTADGIRINKSEMIIYLDLPTHVCLWSVFMRYLRYHGKTRPDLNEGCPERLDWDFFLWILNFRRSKRTRYMELFKSSPTRLVVLRSRREVKQLLRALDLKP